MVALSKQTELFQERNKRSASLKHNTHAQREMLCLQRDLELQDLDERCFVE